MPTLLLPRTLRHEHTAGVRESRVSGACAGRVATTRALECRRQKSHLTLRITHGYILPMLDVNALRNLRESRQLSQDALAKKIGVSQPYIAMLEAGAKKSPSLRILRRLAEALEVRDTELVVSSRRKRAMPPTTEEFEAELF